MKINIYLFLSLLIPGCIMVACRKDKHYDYSNQLLHRINSGKGERIAATQLTFEYDSLNRLSSKAFNLTNFPDNPSYTTYRYEDTKIIQNSPPYHTTFKMNANGRIVSSIESPGMDSTFYDYDADGYLINKRLYRKIYGFQIWQDFKYTYRNGNLVMAVTDYYSAPGTRWDGADTLIFSYDNTAWYPEAKYLQYFPDLFTGKPNRNNISRTQIKPFSQSYNLATNDERDITYTYTEKGNRLSKVVTDVSTYWGYRDTIDIEFSYKPAN